MRVKTCHFSIQGTSGPWTMLSCQLLFATLHIVQRLSLVGRVGFVVRRCWSSTCRSIDRSGMVIQSWSYPTLSAHPSSPSCPMPRALSHCSWSLVVSKSPLFPCPRLHRCAWQGIQTIRLNPVCFQLVLDLDEDGVPEAEVYLNMTPRHQCPACMAQAHHAF